MSVSHTAVSNAFNRPNQLSTKLRESFLAAARSINYSGPNSAARMLRIGFAKTIAVVWTNPMAHAFEGQAGGVLFPEWPKKKKHVSTCFFCRAGPRLAGAVKG